MMVPEAYATVAEYRSAIFKGSVSVVNDVPDDDVDETIERDLLAISRYLDRRLGRIFARDTDPVRRRFYFGYSCWLPTDDMSEEPEMVAVGVPAGAPLDEIDGAIIDQDFRLYPANATLGLHSDEPRPWEGLHFIAPRNYRVPVDIVARWGWPAVPVGIERATIQLAAIWRLETPRATSRVNELEQVVGTSELANRIVKDLIDTYRRVPAFIVA